MGSFIHAVEDEMLCTSLMTDKVPYFNAPIYLQNKSVIGKVDEILGPINEVYFSVKMGEGMVASSFKQGDKVYIAGDKLLPIERFLPKPKVIGGLKKARGARGGVGRGRGMSGGRGSRGGGRGFGRGGSRGGFGDQRNILHAVENHQVLIVVGETGSGKTTQIPQYLYEAGWASDSNVIVCTQPRRVAVTSVASRVAAEVGTVLGDEVGYTIRFEDVTSKDRTRICYVTDGILFREIIVDPLLSRYSVIMVDEAHERSVYTDMLLILLKKICVKRPSLRVIISSATLDAHAFHSFFTSNSGADTAKVVSFKGSTYPVQVAYLQYPTPDYVKAASDLIKEIHSKQGPGDILVFLTGQDEINQCLELLMDAQSRVPSSLQGLAPIALHAGLSINEQMKVFEPTTPGIRKVVIATNIAEASITIEGIHFVIDCGYVKMHTFNAAFGMSILAIVPTSQASAIQRAGRAGRTSLGICYRLYPATTFATLAQVSAPQIVHTDLTQPILGLKSLGIDNLMKLHWLSLPPSSNISQALDTLMKAGILDESGGLTSKGQKIAEFPLDMVMTSMLINSEEFGCGEEILNIVAMSNNIFVMPQNDSKTLAELEHRKFIAEEGDHLTLLNVYNAFSKFGRSKTWCKSHAVSFRALSRAVSIQAQLKKYMERFQIPIKSCQGNASSLQQCIAKSSVNNVAKLLSDGTYESLRGHLVGLAAIYIICNVQEKA
ncbi:hypothetical protein EVG20_g5242 [Dentipellis fragilis]|uniref:H/ACA ribonucleoprotein complex subunit GAR1 n=1 Tax=Dentipellis fragilis TaxID=205917 RepID=A0A4Y9YTG5_9AGAM|nr:hypothetical protein EVG20_g5242 [Dentipellis fragilis]